MYMQRENYIHAKTCMYLYINIYSQSHRHLDRHMDFYRHTCSHTHILYIYVYIIYTYSIIQYHIYSYSQTFGQTHRYKHAYIQSHTHTAEHAHTKYFIHIWPSRQGVLIQVQIPFMNQLESVASRLRDYFLYIPSLWVCLFVLLLTLCRFLSCGDPGAHHLPIRVF